MQGARQMSAGALACWGLSLQRETAPTLTGLRSLAETPPKGSTPAYPTLCSLASVRSTNSALRCTCAPATLTRRLSRQPARL